MTRFGTRSLVTRLTNLVTLVFKGEGNRDGNNTDDSWEDIEENEVIGQQDDENAS